MGSRKKQLTPGSIKLNKTRKVANTEAETRSQNQSADSGSKSSERGYGWSSEVTIQLHPSVSSSANLEPQEFL